MADARQRLYRLATDYALTSDLALILSELVELRDELHTALTTRQHHPNDTRDLYVLLGAACVLLSSISHDLSEPLAGMTQATTAETFAELSGHRGLLTWAYCTKAMIASWWATPTEVLHHAQKARSVGAFGIPAVRLAGLQARALAQLGKRTEAIAVLHAAQDQRDRFGEHNDLQELGEVFTFPLPRQHYYNAATHLHLHNWAAVDRETTTVGDLYGTSTMGRAWPVTLTLMSVPHLDQLEGVWKLGAKYSHYPYANNAEKITASGLSIDHDSSGYGPILSDGISWATCQIVERLDFGGDHGMYVAQIEHVYFNPKYFNPDGTPRSDVRPVMQITGNTFTTAADTHTIPYYKQSTT